MILRIPLQSPMGPMGQFFVLSVCTLGPGYRGYKEDSLFYGREVPDRVQVSPAPPSAAQVHWPATCCRHRQGCIIIVQVWPDPITAPDLACPERPNQVQARVLHNDLLPMHVLHGLAHGGQAGCR